MQKMHWKGQPSGAVDLVDPRGGIEVPGGAWEVGEFGDPWAARVDDDFGVAAPCESVDGGEFCVAPTQGLDDLVERLFALGDGGEVE